MTDLHHQTCALEQQISQAGPGHACELAHAGNSRCKCCLYMSTSFRVASTVTRRQHRSGAKFASSCASRAKMILLLGEDLTVFYAETVPTFSLQRLCCAPGLAFGLSSSANICQHSSCNRTPCSMQTGTSELWPCTCHEATVQLLHLLHHCQLDKACGVDLVAENVPPGPPVRPGGRASGLHRSKCWPDRWACLQAARGGPGLPGGWNPHPH